MFKRFYETAFSDGGGGAANGPPSAGPDTSTPSSPPSLAPAAPPSAPAGGAQLTAAAAPPPKTDPLKAILDAELPDGPALDTPPGAAPALTPPPGAPKPDDDPLAPAAAVPGPGPAAPLEPAQVFEQLGLDVTGLPPEAHGKVSEFLASWYRDRYVPVARQLESEIQRTAQRDSEQEAWYAQAQQFAQTQAWQIAAALAEDPALLARVEGVINGAPTMPAGLPQVNLDELDPTTRAVYETAAHAMSTAQALEAHSRQQAAQVAELQRQLADFGGRQEQQLHTERQRRFTSNVATAQRGLDSAISTFSQKLGFDVRGYKAEFDAAIEHAHDALAAESDRARREGRAPRYDIQEILRIGLERAGFRDIAKRRREQARTTPTLPLDRARGVAAGDPLKALIDQEYEAAAAT